MSKANAPDGVRLALAQRTKFGRGGKIGGCVPFSFARCRSFCTQIARDVGGTNQSAQARRCVLLRCCAGDPRFIGSKVESTGGMDVVVSFIDLT